MKKVITFLLVICMLCAYQKEAKADNEWIIAVGAAVLVGAMAYSISSYQKNPNKKYLVQQNPGSTNNFLTEYDKNVIKELVHSTKSGEVMGWVNPNQQYLTAVAVPAVPPISQEFNACRGAIITSNSGIMNTMLCHNKYQGEWYFM